MSSSPFDRHPFLLSVEDVATRLQTDVESGLDAATIQTRQKEYGPNELNTGDGVAWYRLLAKQLFNPMIVVLVLAMAISFGIKDFVEAGVLIGVIVINASVGFVQELRAERDMEALKKLSSPSATVVRGGHTETIENAKVVPGDIVILQTGDTVPADLRLFEVMNLCCDEQTLTGESLPVDKITENNIRDPTTGELAAEEAHVQDGDRINITFASTVVSKGRGRGIVIATGMNTAVGKITAATSGKKRKPGRSMNAKKYGLRQFFVGGFRRTLDGALKFLGLSTGTPLQQKLAQLAYILFFCAVVLAIVVFGVHKFDIPPEAVIYAISTGIAIIPESLVAVLTLTMVTATTTMKKANVLVRDLAALEALGGITNICSDKTGTLTQGAMIVRTAWLFGSRTYAVHGSEDPNDPTTGRVTLVEDKKPENPTSGEEDSDTPTVVADQPGVTFDTPLPREGAPVEGPPAELVPDLQLFLTSAALCNLSTVFQDRDGNWNSTGEPTEIALQVFAKRFDQNKKTLTGKGWSQLTEFPFDSKIKRMSVVYKVPQHNELGLDAANDVVFAKGAVERILDLCSHAGVGEAQQALDDETKQRILEKMDDFASRGQRVLALAYKKWNGSFELPSHIVPPATGDEEDDAKHAQEERERRAEEDDKLRSEVEQDLTFLGLAGIYDPPREETIEAIQECGRAGIEVHMLTGDHPATARAIAQEVGIVPRNLGILSHDIASSIVMQATEFDKMSEEEIDKLEQLPLVIARCAPDTKTKMIEALRRRGAFMAMTGDGVNDAPSLGRADVGIAMGTGSDVAKSAAKIVLLDDKFNSIVTAIKEGRRLFDNIQKFILHLLASNVGEVILLICGLAFKDEDGFSVFPISPLEILWINLITSSFPAFGLGREKAKPGSMHKPPHKRSVFTWQLIADMVVYGTIMGVCTLSTFIIVVYGKYNGNLGRDCNRQWSEECLPVFRARGAVYAELIWLILISAWQIKDLRRSMFALSDRPFWKDLWENKFLFFSVLLGGASVFLTTFIPGLNHIVFKHKAITWEWGLVIAGLFVFMVGVEAWKFLKRHYGWFSDGVVENEGFRQGSEKSGPGLPRTFSFASAKSAWTTWTRKSKDRVNSDSA